MARLNYEEFKQYCTSNLQKIMGEEYPTYVESKNVNNDIVLDMLRLSKKSENISLNPGLDVMVLYENYCDGKALGEVMLEVVQKMENLLDMKFEVDVHSF